MVIPSEVSGLLAFVSGCIFIGTHFKVSQWTDQYLWWSNGKY